MHLLKEGKNIFSKITNDFLFVFIIAGFLTSHVLAMASNLYAWWIIFLIFYLLMIVIPVFLSERTFPWFTAITVVGVIAYHILGRAGPISWNYPLNSWDYLSFNFWRYFGTFWWYSSILLIYWTIPLVFSMFIWLISCVVSHLSGWKRSRLFKIYKYVFCIFMLLAFLGASMLATGGISQMW